MIAWIRSKLDALNEEMFPSPIPPWFRIAQREIGVHEFRGRENPRIIEYHKTTKLKASEDEIAWCAAFVGWCLEQCGLSHMHSAAARSYLGYGTPLPGFKKYAIVIFRRGNSTWQGHVAFAIDDLGDRVRVLGGNQSDSVTYAVYSKESILGYRWPVTAV